MLKKVNFILSSLLPQKIYWHLAGLMHPWEAVVENVNNPKTLYKQGEDIVKLLEKLKLINRKIRVLDIGCGVGRVEYALAESIEKCVGIDIAPSMIKLARKNVKAKNVTFLITSGDSLREVKDEKFDLVFSLLVFQHLPRRIFQKYVKEANHILVKGGRIFFQIPIYQRQKPSEPPKNHPWALRYYSLEELKRVVRKMGFVGIKFFNPQGEKLVKKDDQAFVLATKAE